jgi:hypothetical protein
MIFTAALPTMTGFIRAGSIASINEMIGRRGSP